MVADFPSFVLNKVPKGELLLKMRRKGNLIDN